jgi:BASS family bile acid:Na+ symporter
MTHIFTPESGRFLRLYSRTAGLFLAMGAGVFSPGAHLLAPLIPYLVALMMFLASLDLSIGPDAFRGSVWSVLAANLAVAFLGYFLFLPFDRDLALVAFLTGVTPTAISAPVIIGFLDGRVEFVVASVLITNLFMALALPFILPLVVGTGGEISTAVALRSVLLVVCVPLGLSRGVLYLPGDVRRAIGRGKPLSFYVWLVALFLVTAKSSHFIRNELTVPAEKLFAIAAISFVICAVNFSVGALLGGRQYRREASQALGQKNNSLTIWLALTFINPVVALGPTCYVLYHNAYNSLQLFAFERRRRRQVPASHTTSSEEKKQ